MKQIILFHFEDCPFCRQARKWIAELQKEYPEFMQLEIKMIDEKLEPELANRYDYWYVPTFYVDGVKVHEGAATKKKVESILRMSLGA